MGGKRSKWRNQQRAIAKAAASMSPPERGGLFDARTQLEIHKPAPAVESERPPAGLSRGHYLGRELAARHGFTLAFEGRGLVEWVLFDAETGKSVAVYEPARDEVHVQGTTFRATGLAAAIGVVRANSPG